MDTFRRRLGLEMSEEMAARPNNVGRLYPALPIDEGWRAQEDYSHSLADNSNNGSSSNDASDVKQKLKSMWNNVKYGKAAWTLQDGGAGAVMPGGEHRGPVWLMGRCYQGSRGRDKAVGERYRREKQLGRHECDIWRQRHPRFGSDEAMQAAFQLDFSSRLWFTYRRDFQEFSGTTMNTDCGWGCMIRSGQMILSNTLLIQKFGRNWRWKEEGKSRGGSPLSTSRQMAQDDQMHRSVVRLFGDCPDATVAPLSIHKLVSIADEVLGRHPGDWFGPSSTAHLLKEGVDRSGHPMLDSICVYVARDCTVYRQDVRDACRRHREKRRPQRQVMHQNRQQRRSRNRNNNNSVSPAVAVEDEEDFSLLQVPEDCPIAAGTGSVVEGVPYVVEAEEAEEDISGFRVVANRKQEARLCKSARGNTGSIKPMELRQTRITTLSSSPQPTDFTLLSDGTENYALNRSLYVEGEQWTVEGQANDSNTRLGRSGAPTASTVSVENSHKSDNAVMNLDAGPEGDWTPLLLLVPLRLGRDRFNMAYFSSLTDAMARPDCVGVIGGRPKHSLYFVGFQDDNLLHMDPHLVQDHVDVFRSNFSVNSFHCKTPRKMHISKMDPSCCIGFYFQTRAAFESWCEEVSCGECGGDSFGNHVMFGVADGRVADADAAAEASLLMATSMTSDEAINDGSTPIALEEISQDFVFL